MKILPPHSRRLFLLTLLFTVVACTLLLGFDDVVEAFAVKACILAVSA